MPHIRFPLAAAVVGLALFGAVCLWQSPGIVSGKITAAELETYLAAVEEMPMPPEDRAEVLRRMRAWGEQDDGQPFYMVNLMRYRAALRRYEGAPVTEMTPEEANHHYEDSVMSLALARGAYPIAAGPVQGDSVLPASADAGRWNRVIVMRYPSRRAFFDLVADPRYAPYAPYKFMAMDLALVPVGAQIVWPEYRWLAAGVLLIAFCALGWLRAARRARAGS